MLQIQFDRKQIQESLPDYRYVSKLGSGAFATVHLVSNRKTNEQVALKKINCFGLGEYEKNCAVNEVRILASLQHTNIIKINSCLFDNNEQIVYIFMEYAEGGDLTHFLDQYKQKKKRIPEAMIWKIIGDLADGLEYLHRNHILHRDLKPANIFRSEGVYKIGDMNVSKILKNGAFASTKTGSPLYTSPEVWDDSPYNEKCDVWSLGVLIYQLCCFRLPYEADSIDQLVKTIKTTKIKGIPTSYSASLFELLKRMLQPSPKKRISAEQIYKIAHEKLWLSSESHKEESTMIDTIVFPETDKRWVNLIPLPPKIKKDEEKEVKVLIKNEKQNSQQCIFRSNSSRISFSSKKKSLIIPRSRSKTRNIGDSADKGSRIRLPSIMQKRNSSHESEERNISKSSRPDIPMPEKRQGSTSKITKKNLTNSRKNSVKKLLSRPPSACHH